MPVLTWGQNDGLDRFGLIGLPAMDQTESVFDSSQEYKAAGDTYRKDLHARIWLHWLNV